MRQLGSSWSDKLSLLSDRMSARQSLCPSAPLITLDQHAVQNLLDLAWALW